MGPPLQPSNETTFRDATFLIVDDKPHFRNMVHSALAGRTAGVADASSVDRAIALLNQPAHEITCVISDWEMWPVGGLELLRMIHCGAIANALQRLHQLLVTASRSRANRYDVWVGERDGHARRAKPPSAKIQCGGATPAHALRYLVGSITTFRCATWG